MFERLRAQSLEPNIINYNATISACEKASQWELTLQLLDLALLRRLPSDVISYAACASGCEKAARWREALSLLRRAEEEHLQVNAILCNAVIGACGRAREVDRGLALMREIPEPLTDTYNAAIGVCLDQWQQALQFFDDLQNHPRAAPDLISFNSTIHVLCLGQHWQRATTLLRPCRNAKLVPDATSYTILLSVGRRGSLG